VEAYCLEGIRNTVNVDSLITVLREEKLQRRIIAVMSQFRLSEFIEQQDFCFPATICIDKVKYIKKLHAGYTYGLAFIVKEGFIFIGSFVLST
jgi:hypothetical protein